MKTEWLIDRLRSGKGNFLTKLLTGALDQGKKETEKENEQQRTILKLGVFIMYYFRTLHIRAYFYRNRLG